MKPELDPAYPLGSKISTPRMIIEQSDAVNAAVIAKLSKAVLQDLDRFFKRQEKATWLTLYLAIFILLHEADVTTEDRRRHGRANNNKSDEIYSLPMVVHEIQKGANVLLHFWLYYRNEEDPSTMTAVQWRASSRLSALTSEQFDFVRRSAQELKRKSKCLASLWNISYRKPRLMTNIIGAEFKATGDDMWECPLYWVSQMYDKNWTPSRVFPGY
jgi:hypothetical protein